MPHVDMVLCCINLYIVLQFISSIYTITCTIYLYIVLLRYLANLFHFSDKEVCNIAEHALSPIFSQEQHVASLCALVIVQ